MIQLSNQLTERRQVGHLSHLRAQLATDRVALEVPRHVLANLAQAAGLIAKGLHQQFCVAVNHVRHLSQGRADTLRRTLKRILQVTKQPRATLAAAANHHAVHAGLLNHTHRILSGENIAITQNRHVRNQLTQLRNRIPVSLTRIMLSRSTTVQSNRRNTGITSNLGGLQERDVVIVDALTHLNGQRNIVAGRLLHRSLHNRREQVSLPGQGGTATAASHLRSRAAKVQVNVVGTVLFNDHAHSLTDVDRVHTVNLDGSDFLVRVMLNNAHGLGLTLHQGARSHHLGNVQTTAIFTAEAAESLIGHASHRGENHGSINGQIAQFQGRKGKTGCFRIHPYIVAYGGKSRTGLS